MVCFTKKVILPGFELNLKRGSLWYHHNFRDPMLVLFSGSGSEFEFLDEFLSKFDNGSESRS